MQGAQKFSKIELLIRVSPQAFGEVTSTDTLVFNNVGMAISGSHIIIADTITIPNPEWSDDSGPMVRSELPVSTTGTLFNLNEVVSYKTTN